MSTITLVRKGSEVYHNDIKLTINAQASKGPGNEVVKVEGIQEANGAKWVSLSRLKEGPNELTLQGKARTSKAPVAPKVEYVLNKDEAKIVDDIDLQMAKLMAKKQEIIDKASERFVPKPNFDIDISELDDEAKQDLYDQVDAWMKFVESNK